MANVDGKRFLDAQVAQIKQRTKANQKVAVAFDVDNTLFDTRGRALAIGKMFDKANGTTYFKSKTRKQMGNDAKETSTLVGMSKEHAKKFSSLWFREFFKGENYKNDTQIKKAVDLAKRAARAGADVFYVTARTQSEESFTIAQLAKAGLPTVDADFVVSKPKMKDKTPDYKAAELKRISKDYEFVGWFVTESRKDIQGIKSKGAPVDSVLMETKFSGTGNVGDQTPVWKVDVK
jgi:predicted secreted acid phosphatase